MALYLRERGEDTFAELKRRGSPIGFLGAPLDETSSYRGGSRWGPEAVRRASRSLELCTERGSCRVEDAGVDDLGDVVTAPGNIEESLERIAHAVTYAFRELGKKFLVIVGGEHTITLGALKGVDRAFGPPCLLVFDAHLDLRSEYLGSAINHATVMRRAIERGLVERIAWVGIRAFSREELEELRRLEALGSGLAVSCLECLEHSPRFVASRIASFFRECQCVYVSLDMDSVDPAYAPGVQTPEPMGLSPRWLAALLRIIAESSRTVCLDVVELSPPNDPGEQTSFLAARLILETIEGVLRRI